MRRIPHVFTIDHRKGKTNKMKKDDINLTKQFNIKALVKVRWGQASLDHRFGAIAGDQHLDHSSDLIRHHAILFEAWDRLR